ncbi:phage holin family protein [Bartonella raoultii]|uniref:Phage holin family protein n=1 Tax=Bartonella raoultii TaxID=1457020 RepID=A0ABS7I4S3_9HYPH|nr:phage holin family protein [Bartonella raoultii]MBX4335821.1 phage holin family protein [Bartonella raoultii]
MHKLITPVLNHLVGGGLKSTVKQVRLQAIFCGIIGVSLFMALVFLCVIGFLALCLVMKPLGAASVLFFIWLFLAGLSALIGRILKTSQRYEQQKKEEEQRHQLMTQTTLSSLALLGKHLPFAKLSVPILGLTSYFLWKKEKKDRFSD